MSHLIFVRHGESELNVANQRRRVFCGQTDTPLTDIGRQQARAVGDALAARDDLRVERAISSSLSRWVLRWSARVSGAGTGLASGASFASAGGAGSGTALISGTCRVPAGGATAHPHRVATMNAVGYKRLKYR